MPPKKAAASSGNNAKQKVSLALEAHSDLDLKKFLENYPKNAARFQQEVHFGIISRFKSEYQAIRDMVQMDVPKFPISIHEPLCFEALTSLLLTLESYPWLRHLCFWKCQLEDDGAMLIADFIRHQFQIIYDKNPWGVETVELPQNKIGPRGVNFIGRMLTTNETIKVLVLDFNPIESEGAILLSDGLKWNSTLERLSLHYCSIGPDGGEAIGHHIVRSSGIKSLELRGNPIGPRGVISIGHALAKNAHLVKLDLANTAFGLDLEAVEVLRDGIESNETLEWVDLNLNSIIPTGAPLLVEMLAKKPKITRFELYERVAHGLFNETMIALSNNVKAGKKKGKGKKRGNSAKGKKSKGPPAPST